MRKWYDDRAFMFGCLLIVVIGVVLFSIPVKAHEGQHKDGHSVLHHWYKQLMRPDAPHSSCCNDQDCRPTQARWVNDHWEAQKDGRWVSIPNYKVNREESFDSQAHICAPPTNYQSYHKDFVFCFIKPGPGI